MEQGEPAYQKGKQQKISTPKTLSASLYDLQRKQKDVLCWGGIVHASTYTCVLADTTYQGGYCIFYTCYVILYLF